MTGVADESARWHADGYLEWVRAGMPNYDRLQRELVGATSRLSPRQILELGSGTGETARHILDAHPQAQLIGIDGSEDMLAAARAALAGRPASFHLARLEGPLPAGPFDLIVSALAIHHLPAQEKQALYARIAAALAPGGRFVLADVVVPDDPAEAEIELSEYDLPSPIPDQLDWLHDAGLQPHLCWSEKDLVVIAADRPRG
jgi:tRNA (cmo5U34)-methyltransferase